MKPPLQVQVGKSICEISPIILQAQYVFIHDSLSELVMCGETEVAAGDLRMKMMALQKPVAGDPSGLIGYHKEFQVSTLHHVPIAFLTF